MNKFTSKIWKFIWQLFKLKSSSTLDHEEFFRATGGSWEHLSVFFMLKTLEHISHYESLKISESIRDLLVKRSIGKEEHIT